MSKKILSVLAFVSVAFLACAKEEAPAKNADNDTKTTTSQVAKADAAPAAKSDAAADTKASEAAPAAKAGDEAKKPSKLDYIEQDGQKYILVSTIGTIEANRQFMQNVNLVNQQRKQIQTLVEANKIVVNKSTHEAIVEEIETASKKLQENNATMAKNYGYSLDRKYIHAIVKTRIFIKLTDDEYKNAKEDPATKPDDLLLRGDDKYRLIAIIPGVEENNLFRRNVQLVQTQRSNLVKMKKAAETAEGETKAKIEEEAKKAEETLVKNNQEMTKRYGFSLSRDYLMEIEESKLYTQVNEEEFVKAERAAEKAALDADAKAVIEDAKK